MLTSASFLLRVFAVLNVALSVAAAAVPEEDILLNRSRENGSQPRSTLDIVQQSSHTRSLEDGSELVVRFQKGNMNKRSIGSALRSARISKGLTINDLARKANMRSSSVQAIEAGKSQPSAAELSKLERVLGVRLRSRSNSLASRTVTASHVHSLEDEAEMVARSEGDGIGKRSVASAIRSARIAKGLKVNTLAAMVGTTTSSIAAFEAGKTKPSSAVLSKLERVLGVKLR